MVPQSEGKPDWPAADTFEPLSPMREALRMFLRNRAAILGVVLMAIVLLV
jgi:hypothetical protein